MYMLYIVAASSTNAVSRVSWVNVVLTLCTSTGVLFPCCLFDAAMDPIPHHSAFLFVAGECQNHLIVKKNKFYADIAQELMDYQVTCRRTST